MSNSDTSIGSERLDSDLLRTFLAIADTGSFTRGAARIFRSQSAASLQMKRLEQILALPVFERHARGIALTPTGERLLPLARRVVDLLDVSAGELRSDALEGTLRLGIPDEYGSSLLPQVIARFSRIHPRVELSVRCSFSTGFPNALAADELDLAIHSVEAAPPGSHTLTREKTVWATSRHHGASEQDPLPVALFDRACWWRDQALNALQASGKRFRIAYSSESVTGVMAAISAGAAIGLLAESAISDELKILGTADGFKPVPDSVLVLERGSNGHSPAADAMVLLIGEAFGISANHTGQTIS